MKPANSTLALPLVPQPRFIQTSTEPKPAFVLNAANVASADPQTAQLAAKLLTSHTGTEVTANRDSTARTIDLVLEEEGANYTAESYRLQVDTDAVTLSAGSEQGLQRGLATLAQLVANDAQSRVVVPLVTIEDSPRYPWRGLSLDVARSFYTVEEVERVIDMLWLYKFNRLHLHLTDDQGWRLEIPGWEALTEVSGNTAGEGGTPGFYSTEDFARIQDYAQARGIVVVPEIDMPGHTNAATHAYGELNPTGQPTPAYAGTKVGFSMLHPELPATEKFLQGVIGSVAAQTRGPYLHFGGDEALDMNQDNYRILVERIDQIIRENGKQPVAWQEAAAADLTPPIFYQFWDPRLDTDDLAQAVNHGAQIIISIATRTYFDMKYDASTPYGQDWAGYVSLEDAYAWDPARVIPGVDEADIAGVEAAIWTEKIQDFTALSYQLLPRLAATAEVGWAPTDSRNADDFFTRLGSHRQRWSRQGWDWHPSLGLNGANDLPSQG